MDLRERAEHNALAEADTTYRAMFRHLCQTDPVFFINTCCWTFDPRVRKHKGWHPFLLFDKQEELVTWIVQRVRDGEDFGVEKSRDTGVSWIVCAVLVWMWLYEDGFNALIGSWKEDLVDKSGEPKCLFWKIDSLIQSLPAFMYPDGYKPEAPYRSHLKCLNPVNGNIISGESPSQDYGRAGRSTVAILDEMAFWPYPTASWTACGQTSTCRGAVSTPKGMNFFGQLMNMKKNALGSLKKFRIHWMDDPRHNHYIIDPKTGMKIYPWYEEQKARYAYDTAMIAQELDISYKGSVGRMVYPQVKFVGRGEQKYDPMRPTYVSWDYGVDDFCALGWFQWAYEEGRYKMIDSFQGNGHPISWYVPFVTGAVPSGSDVEGYSPDEIEVILRHKGWRVDEHYGDPAGIQRNSVTATSVIETLAKYGIYVITNNQAIIFPPRHEATKSFLMKLDVDDERCEHFLTCIEQAKFAQEAENTNSTSANKLPVHDWTAHFRAMVEYMAVNEPHLRDPLRKVTYQRTESGETVAVKSYELDEYDDYQDYTLAPRGRAGY